MDVADKPTLVYNLEAAEDHSYFVGDEGAWAHNKWYNRTLGGSGKPRRYFPEYPSRKAAKDAARRAGNGPPIFDCDEASGPHFHPTDRNGDKMDNGQHFKFPR